MARAAWMCLALACASLPAHAAYSGLTLVPTADILGPEQSCLAYQLCGPFPVGSGVDAAFVNTEFAVGPRAEVGIDFDFTTDAPTGAVFNSKLLLRPVEAGVGLAVGALNVGENLRPTSYIAATRGGLVRLHAGALLTPDNEVQGFGGLDYSLNDLTQLYADYIAGDDNFAALGISYQFADRWAVLFAWLHPNSPDVDDSFLLDIGCVYPVD